MISAMEPRFLNDDSFSPWTNPYPAGPKKLVHSAATLSHVHSNICTMTFFALVGARATGDPLANIARPTRREGEAKGLIVAA